MQSRKRAAGLVLQPNSHATGSDLVDSKRPKTDSSHHQALADERPDSSLIETSLNQWVAANLDAGASGADVEDRRSALVEVGQLLINEDAKYPSAIEMREEIGDLVTQLGGEHLLEAYISFLLQTRQQVKSAESSLEAQQQSMGGFPGFHGMHPMMPPPGMMFMPPPYGPVAVDPMTGMPIFPFPPDFYSNQQFNYGRPHFPPGHPVRFQPGMMPPPPPPPPASRGNMVLSRSNEPTAVQKLKEREQKRKELLQTFTDELKQLVAKASEAPDDDTKAKYVALIEDVKKKISSLSSAASSSKAPAPAPKPSVGIVGFYGNQYINPDSKAKPSHISN